MIQETITQIEGRINEAKSLNDEKKRELLNLLVTTDCPLPRDHRFELTLHGGKSGWRV